ncbi:MAG: AraC family transcriptional regulator [Acinetobacter populi]|uniref:AraC family transcriptional regulator n=1 Tax=Acinetobacter populi TaxID=1582270 RepID=UPI002353331F|nr:AraC family transcriptional regulator [Acinetobacter populi]MCH4246734.1 AraC family transcriptional regulator [Acinetobacter populi]
MQATTQPPGSVYGGLSDLLRTFCQARQIAMPEKLQQIQNLERFDYNLWREILTEIDNQLQQPALGLEIARYVQLKHLGVLGYLAQSCVNLGEALQRYHDFHRLVYDGSPLIIQAESDYLSIRWDVPEIFTTQITNEIAIALMNQFLLHFLHIDDIELSEVSFVHTAPKNAHYYAQYFRCQVKFSQPFAQIKVPISLLGKPIRHADQTLQELLTHQAQALLAKLPNSSELDERLQQAILKGLQKHRCQIEDIATQLNMSIRKLQRHLQLQNTTFQQRVQALRLMLAQQYLKDRHLSLLDIALLLGYSEQSAFQRAFKHWTGQTPQNWRSTHRQ